MIDKILDKRQDTHGKFRNVAASAQAIKAIITNGQSYGMLVPEQRESLDLIATKIARIIEGNPNHKDGWVDIEGYARLVSRYLNN